MRATATDMRPTSDSGTRTAAFRGDHSGSVCLPAVATTGRPFARHANSVVCRTVTPFTTGWTITAHRCSSSRTASSGIAPVADTLPANVGCAAENAFRYRSPFAPISRAVASGSAARMPSNTGPSSGTVCGP